MPIYEYRCRSCAHQFEHLQKFTDPNMTVCPNCSGQLDKLIHTPSIVFKGSGFYKTDSRGSAPAVAAPESKPVKQEKAS